MIDTSQSQFQPFKSLQHEWSWKWAIFSDHKLINISFYEDYRKYTQFKKNKRGNLWGICLASIIMIFRNYFAKTFPKIDLYVNSSMQRSLDRLPDIRLSSDIINKNHVIDMYTPATSVGRCRNHSLKAEKHSEFGISPVAGLSSRNPVL